MLFRTLPLSHGIMGKAFPFYHYFFYYFYIVIIFKNETVLLIQSEKTTGISILEEKKRQMCNALLNAKLAGLWPPHFQ